LRTFDVKCQRQSIVDRALLPCQPESRADEGHDDDGLETDHDNADQEVQDLIHYIIIET
jgi:hypothetical protein